MDLQQRIQDEYLILLVKSYVEKKLVQYEGIPERTKINLIVESILYKIQIRNYEVFKQIIDRLKEETK